MKKIIFLLLLTVPLLVQAQLHVSTNSRQDYTWSSASSNWLLVSENVSDISLLDFNKRFTVMRYTTSSGTYSYTISRVRETTPRELYELDLVSQYGSRYLMVIDLRNKVIQFLNSNYTTLVQHTIQRSWFE